MLAKTGAGAWHPERSARSWVRFNLTAHHMQAQTVLRRVDDANRMFVALEALAESRRLPERVSFVLYPAAFGLRVRRPAYEKDAAIEPGTAGRDLRILMGAGLVEARGETRGRYYIGTPELLRIRQEVVSVREPLRNPYTEAEPEQLELPEVVGSADEAG